MYWLSETCQHVQRATMSCCPPHSCQSHAHTFWGLQCKSSHFIHFTSKLKTQWMQMQAITRFDIHFLAFFLVIHTVQSPVSPSPPKPMSLWHKSTPPSQTQTYCALPPSHHPTQNTSILHKFASVCAFLTSQYQPQPLCLTQTHKHIDTVL